MTTVDCCGDVVTRVRRLQPDVFTLSNLLSACSRINDFERAKLYWRSLLRAQGTREGALRYHVAGGARSPVACTAGAMEFVRLFLHPVLPPPVPRLCSGGAQRGVLQRVSALRVGRVFPQGRPGHPGHDAGEGPEAQRRLVRRGHQRVLCRREAAHGLHGTSRWTQTTTVCHVWRRCQCKLHSWLPTAKATIVVDCCVCCGVWQSLCANKVSACGRVALVPGVVIGRDQVYDDMRSHGIAPNVDVFSALVMTAIRAKSMELGREAVLLMEQEGVAKNEKIYSLLVHLAAISNDVRAHTLRGVARDGRGSTLPVLSRSRALRRQ